LKFFVHHGDYIVQSISGIKELVGSDVNLVHRLMKNHISETTGWRAYALFTESALNHIGYKTGRAAPRACRSSCRSHIAEMLIVFVWGAARPVYIRCGSARSP